jgi:ribonuclease D
MDAHQASPAPALVADGEALARLVDVLLHERVVALDTESNSFHVYRERVCLLQISAAGRDWIVDPFAVDVAPLGAVLCDGRETVLHGADYDVRCLKREYGWRLPRLFDTMTAARRLGRAGLGLQALVEEEFGVRLSKTHQRSDWGRRPLTRDQLAYAALDTRYLLPLHDRLSAALAERGLADAARTEFDRIAAAEPHVRVFDPEGWRKMKRSRELDVEARGVLRALWLAREERASAIDRPPFKVLADETMVEIARQRPRSIEALKRLSGVTPSVLNRMGEAILGAVATSAAA